MSNFFRQNRRQPVQQPPDRKAPLYQPSLYIEHQTIYFVKTPREDLTFPVRRHDNLFPKKLSQKSHVDHLLFPAVFLSFLTDKQEQWIRSEERRVGKECM